MTQLQANVAVRDTQIGGLITRGAPWGLQSATGKAQRSVFRSPILELLFSILLAEDKPMTIIRISEKYNSAALGVRDKYHLEDRDFSQEEILQPLTRPYKQSLDQELVLRADGARIQIDG